MLVAVTCDSNVDFSEWTKSRIIGERTSHKPPQEACRLRQLPPIKGNYLPFDSLLSLSSDP